MLLCHPTWLVIAKSHETMVCTENMTGMIAKAKIVIALCR